MKEKEEEILSPQEYFSDLLERVNLLVKIRWAIFPFLILLILYFSFLHRKGFNPFPLLSLLFLIFLFNLTLHLDLRRHRVPKEATYLKRALNLQFFFDVFFYLFLFHFTGGIESPFFILLIFPAISSTLIFSPPGNFIRASLLLLLFALFLYAEVTLRLNPAFLLIITPGEKSFLIFLSLAGALCLSILFTSGLLERLKERLKNLVLLQKDLRRNYLETVMALAQAVEAKDPEIKGHLERSIKYATLIGERLGLKEEEMEALRFGAVLHDIGKIGIDDKILFKPGKLTPEEYEKVKEHPRLGAQIIEGVEFLKEVAPIILYHHERYDGKGYPEGLKGEEIPLLARIISVVDAYETMISSRPYKKPFSKEEAKKEMLREKGKQFDPYIVDIFLKILEER